MSLFRKSRSQPWSEELFDQVTRHGLPLRLFSMTLTRTYAPSDPGQVYYERPATPARLYLENWQVEGTITGWKHQLINCTIEIVRDPPWTDAQASARFFDNGHEAALSLVLFDPDGQLEDAMRKSFAAVQPVYPARGVPFTINLDRAATWETISESRRCDIQSYQIHECWDGHHNPHLHARRAAYCSELLVSAGALYLIFRLADQLNTTITETIGLNLYWLVWFSLCVGVFSWLSWYGRRILRYTR